MLRFIPFCVQGGDPSALPDLLHNSLEDVPDICSVPAAVIKHVTAYLWVKMTMDFLQFD